MRTSSETKLLKAFGKRIATIRKQRGITQQKLAEELGMSVVAIAYIETGQRWIRLSTLGKMAKVLKVNVRDFFQDI
jgi:transcriptional regulator with XRE-family HTH domain